MCEPRCTIIRAYASWTVRCALGRAPIRSNDEVAQLLGAVDFQSVLLPNGPIGSGEFSDWHRSATIDLQIRGGNIDPGFTIGWAAKAINIYLKTAAYVGNCGRDGIRFLLHPPLDNALLRALNCHPAVPESMRANLVFAGIGAITDYDTQYLRIIDTFRQFASALPVPCTLFEVEQFWAV